MLGRHVERYGLRKESTVNGLRVVRVLVPSFNKPSPGGTEAFLCAGAGVVCSFSEVCVGLLERKLYGNKSEKLDPRRTSLFDLLAATADEAVRFLAAVNSVTPFI